MTTKSPRPAASSTVSRRAARSRSCSSSASIPASSASGSRRGDLEALVVAELGGRPHADLEVEAQRLALPREVGEVELRVADRMDAGAVDRLGVPAAERAAHRLVEDGLATDALDDDRRRDLALAEAGHPHVLAERIRGALERALDLLGGHLGLDANA